MVTFLTGSHRIKSYVIKSNLRKPKHSGWYSFDQILMNLCQNISHHQKRTDLKVGHLGSESRSDLRKIMCTLYQARFGSNLHETLSNVCHHENLDKYETGSCQVKK